ncbi:putative NAD dependent epimerase dehydratase family protein [Coleophoma cylindrospora]|uniref:Putative NAD dependent epimerase dehydratase family protein n=1 Tax=Coleophoma cylindrospora TaxID=1849047 RepID=A0A3D8RL93_9HELO|nr:putative NAD dependent epimerase dehydratase family protein [Coleophoma cylindrospora]
MSRDSKYASYPSLEGRVVVISGGATGIGASMVEAFAAQRAQVVFLDILSDAATVLIQELTDLKVAHSPIYYECDMTNIEGGVKPTAAKILARFPHVHVLINNAASDTRQKMMEITEELWDQSAAINVRHQFFLTQSLMPGLIASGSASVINMGSIAWTIQSFDIVPYATSKAAIVGLTKMLAHELGPQGVRVNSIMPGAIATDRQLRDVLTPDVQAHIMKQQALKRMLQPAEVARMALWLAADDSAGVTNQSMVIDAGWISW